MEKLAEFKSTERNESNRRWRKILSVVGRITAMVGGALAGFKYGGMAAAGLGLLVGAPPPVTTGLTLLGKFSGTLLGSILGKKFGRKVADELKLDTKESPQLF